MTVMRAVVLAVLLSACADDAPPAETMYDRLGGEPGIRAVIEDFVAKLGADDKVNGYFLNRSVDLDHVTRCFVLQLDELAGGPQDYPGDSGCRSMADAHAGLGISQLDFDDVMTHLLSSLEEADVTADDRATISAALLPMADDIVEDPDSDATVYQRVGRKPAIATVVTNFESRVAADSRVNGFFAGIQDFTRIHACLTRQVCSIDGPCKYGEEVAAEFGDLSTQFPCRGMVPAHIGLADENDSPITIDDFNAIAENLITELDAAGVTPADRDAIIGAIAPLCAEIVADGTGCP